MDFLIVPTVGFRLLFVLVILRHERRRLISLSVTAYPTAEWIARQITDAFPWDEAPDYLIRDRDASYGSVVTKRLAAMGIRDHPMAPRSPWQNGHAERLIGSIRRECLDHMVVFGESHLRRILTGYASCPSSDKLIRLGSIWKRGSGASVEQVKRLFWCASSVCFGWSVV
jgi:transposase InsO family protein